MPLLVSNSPIFDDNGELMGCVHIAKDITERKQMEESLRESEEKHRNLLENARDTIIALDLDGNVTFVNRVIEEYGFKKDEVLGKSMAEFVPEKYHPKLIKDFAKVIRGNQAEGEIEIITPKGKLISEYRSNPIRRGNKVIGSQTILRDITERKRAEKALKESEEKFRNIFESASDAMIYLDRSGRILDFNRKAVELFGGSKKELLGKHFVKVGVISPRDIPKLLSAFAVGLAGKQASLSIRIKNRKGREIPLECSGSLTKTGDRLAVLVIARDVTERKKAEERIRESEEKYRNLVELAPDGIATVNRKGVVTSVNTAFSKLTGFSKDKLVGKHFTKLGTIRARDLPNYLKLISSVFRGKIPPPVESVYLRRDGTQAWAEAHIGLLREDDKTIGIQAIVRDITERKMLEEKLRQYSEHLEELVQKRTEELLESEKRYSVLVEEASDGVVILQDEKIAFANQKAPEIGGYSRDEIIGLHYEKLVEEKYRQYAKELYVGRLRGEEFPATAEIELIAKTGEGVPVELSGTRINYQGRPAVLTILRDISERKQMEEERLKLEKLATIGELATMVGHDLRNPLQAIENATYYLNNEIPRLLPSILISQKAVEMLEIINNSVNYADKIIKDLHDFSATKKPTLKKTNINTILKETLSQVETPENIELTTELDHLPKVKADKDMIKRAFLNLTINAIQAMEKGGTLKVSTKKTNGFVEVSFKDTGIGMSKENMKKLFTPFFTTRAKGMGMGLPICKKFVEIHGGNIQVESKEGKGTNFTVKLPIQ